jgi:hypothetical protein
MASSTPRVIKRAHLLERPASESRLRLAVSSSVKQLYHAGRRSSGG